MKAIIQGVLYDTDAATEIGEFIVGEGPGSIVGVVYKTPRSGRYFIHGKGGFLTRFRDGPRIVPISEGELRSLRATLLRKQGG